MQEQAIEVLPCRTPKSRSIEEFKARLRYVEQSYLLCALSQLLIWVDRQHRTDTPPAAPILFVGGREWHGDDDLRDGEDGYGYGSSDDEWFAGPLF